MTTIRRIYAYLLAFAGLAMLAIATAHLLQLLVDLGLQSPTARLDRYVRDTASLYAAIALVGLPVWLVHWLWIRHSARADPQERTSTLRRLYLYAILAAATLVVVGSARDVLSSAFGVLVGIATPDRALDAIARPLPFTVIALGVWFAHWRLAAADRIRVGEQGGSATLRRWYVYGAAWLGLVLLLAGAQGVVEAVWRMLVSGASVSAGSSIVQPAADALVGLGLWWAHLVGQEREDETSVLKSVYLFLALAVVVTGSLLGLSQLLYYGVGRVLGVDHPGGVGDDLLLAAAGPASVAIVYGVAWGWVRGLQRRALGHEAPRQTGVRRLYLYLIALVALNVLATGAIGLLWTFGDVVLGALAVTSGMSWRDEVAQFATLTIVGLPVWLRHWQPTPATVAEARSLARRLYVYLSLIGAMLALVGSAAAGLYKVLRLALGDSFSVDVAADLVHALAIAGVAAMFAAYHWHVVRSDTGALVTQSSQNCVGSLQTEAN